MAEDSREREELSFLVGNSCSRTINLLMNPSGAGRELREELAFLSEKAARLAELIAREQEAEEPAGEAAEQAAGEEPG